MKETRVKFQLEKNILIEPEPLQGSIEDDALLLSYVRADYDIIMAENKATIQMMNNGGVLDHHKEHFCSRGLEAKTQLGSRRRRNIKRRAQDAVLDEQTRQHYENDEDPEMISEVYKGFTIPCHAQAQRQGTRDYECVTVMVSRKHRASSKCTNKAYPRDGILSLPDENATGSAVMTDTLPLMNRREDMRTAAILGKASTAVKRTHLGIRGLFGQNNFSQNLSPRHLQL